MFLGRCASCGYDCRSHDVLDVFVTLCSKCLQSNDRNSQKHFLKPELLRGNLRLCRVVAASLLLGASSLALAPRDVCTRLSGFSAQHFCTFVRFLFVVAFLFVLAGFLGFCLLGSTTEAARSAAVGGSGCLGQPAPPLWRPLLGCFNQDNTFSDLCALCCTSVASSGLN